MASGPPGHVVIIGAGIAGIAAARTLHSSGFKVTVLESNNRIGGRIHTDTESFGVPVDLGASWIHGASPLQNPIAGIAAALNLATYETSAAGSLLYDHTVQRGFQLYTVGAARIERDTVRKFDAWLRGVVEREKGDTGCCTSTLEATVHRIVEENGIQGTLYEELLNFYVCRIEGWFAAEAAEISSKSWLEEEFYQGGHLLLRNGYSQLVYSLAEGIDIRLNHRVTNVAHDQSQLQGVKIRCENGFWTDADAVIVAVPLGVLQKNVIRFEPELPKWKRRTISELEVGHQNKIGLLFDSVFWPEDAEFIGLAGGTPRGCSYFLSMYRAVHRAALVYMPVGDLAREIETLSDAHATQFAMDRLREMIPGAPEPVSSVVTRWSTDPNFMGCYSNDKTPEGSDLHFQMGLAVSERLHFAGEACSAEFSSTVHGAYQSGVDAARHVAERYRHMMHRYGGDEEAEQSLMNSRHIVSIVPCNLAAHLVDNAKPGLTEISQVKI